MANIEVLRTQIGILTPNAPRALRLAAATFTFDDILYIGSEGTEVAILGQPGTLLTGGPTNVPPMLSLSFGATLYMANLTIADGPNNALNASSDSLLWLDDVVIRGYGNSGLAGAGEAHLRRCRIRAANYDVFWQSGALFMENTALGPGAGVGLETTGSPIIDARYVTIAGNAQNLVCNASPGPSGLIRNSILAGTTDPTISGSACQLLSFTGNAVDQAGFGSLIEHFDATWFRDAANADFHLTAGGAQAIGDTATLASDDPQRDIDGATRPSGRNGAPGIDQP